MPTKGPHYDPNQPLKVHPVAALFPMMTEDELNDLALDIKANGLVHPIVLDADGQLIDGRNRLEACGRAVVEPTFTTLPDGQDAVAFILSANIERRHLNKGQQAMARGMARASKTAKIAVSAKGEAELSGISERYLNQANVVMKFAPELADSVLAGAAPLDRAYEEARRRKEEQETETEKQARLRAKFEAIQRDAPDLGSLVQEERLTLDEALSALEQRRRDEERKRQEELENRRLLTGQLYRAFRTLDPVNIDPQEMAESFAEEVDGTLIGEEAVTSERARRVADVLLRYASLLETEDEANAS